MIVTKNLKNAKSKEPSILTLGTFDGVHQGHKKIIKQLINESRKNNLRSFILTFFPHPRNVLKSNSEVKSISTLEEKTEIFSKLGVQELIIQDFDKSFSSMTAGEFIELLVNNLNLKKIIVGFNHKFGKNRSADINVLKSYSFKYNFEVIEIKAFEIKDLEISSTRIRNSIDNGNIERCNSFLGYNFNVLGKVIKGKSIGKSIGFPTANLDIIVNYKILPKNGVYLVKSTVEKKELYGMMNIGFNPTFGMNKKTIEVHFFNYNNDLYNKEIKVELLKFIRDEIKFETIEKLQTQLNSDREKCVNYINSTFNN